jgi:hypothetical protein
MIEKAMYHTARMEKDKFGELFAGDAPHAPRLEVKARNGSFSRRCMLLLLLQHHPLYP